MLKNNEKSIGNVNLVTTFLILMMVAFVVIMLSVNSKLDDFEGLQTEIKTKFLEDKKNDIKYKLYNLNVLIDSHGTKNIEKNKKFIKEFISKINKSKHNIITIKQLSTSMPYYENLVQKGEYYKNDQYFDEKMQKNIVSC